MLCASSAFRQRAAAVLLQTSRFTLFPFFLARGGKVVFSLAPSCGQPFSLAARIYFLRRKKNKSRVGWLFGKASLSSRCFPLGPAFPQPGRELLLFLFFPPICTFPRGGQAMEGLLQPSPCPHPGRGCGTRGGRPARFAPSFVCVWKGSTARFPLKIMKYGTSFVLFV